MANLRWVAETNQAVPPCHQLWKQANYARTHRTLEVPAPKIALRRSFRVENPVQDNWCRLHCRLHIDSRRYLNGCGRGPGTWNVHVDFGIPDFGIRDLGIRELGIRDLGIRDLGIRDLGILAVVRRDEPQKAGAGSLRAAIRVLMAVRREGPRSFTSRSAEPSPSPAGCLPLPAR